MIWAGLLLQCHRPVANSSCISACPSMKNNVTGVARLVAAFGFSLQGLKTTYATEAAFRQEVWLAVVLLPLALLLGSSPLEQAILSASVLLLLVVELLNSGIEKVVDRIGDDYHELSGAAKDAGSAAVLLTLCIVVVIWLGALFTN